jgi:formylglycine-generating enzyme required for sulfatase activity
MSTRAPAPTLLLLAFACSSLWGCARTVSLGQAYADPTADTDAGPTVDTDAGPTRPTSDVVLTVADGEVIRCPGGMAAIPGGTFLMGDPTTDSPSELGVHRVQVSSFCMDLTEVTVAAYRQCPACRAPSTTVYCNWGLAGRENHPVNCVDWNQSDAYCRWRGASLPTEAQWEYSTRGTDGRTYPWGDTPPDAQLCWSASVERAGTCPVRSFPAGDSPFGLADMAGNAWEWTADFWGAYDTSGSLSVDPTGAATGTSRVSRGGSWSHTSGSLINASHRNNDFARPGTSDFMYGFRCARRPL